MDITNLMSTFITRSHLFYLYLQVYGKEKSRIKGLVSTGFDICSTRKLFNF
jgi:hypothetical protein